MWRAEGMLLELTAIAPAYAGISDISDKLRRRFTPSKKMYRIGDYIFEANDQSEFAKAYRQEQRDGRNQLFKEMHWLLNTMTQLVLDQLPTNLRKLSRRDLSELLVMAWSERTDARAEYQKKQQKYDDDNKLHADVELFEKTMVDNATTATADTPSVELVESTPSEDSTPSTRANTRSTRSSAATSALSALSFVGDLLETIMAAATG